MSRKSIRTMLSSESLHYGERNYSGWIWAVYFILYDLIAFVYMISLVLIFFDFVEQNYKHAPILLYFLLWVVFIAIINIIGSRWEYRSGGKHKRRLRELLKQIREISDHVQIVQEQGEIIEDEIFKKLDDEYEKVEEKLSRKTNLSLKRPFDIGITQTIIEIWVTIRELSLILALFNVVIMFVITGVILLTSSMALDRFLSVLYFSALFVSLAIMILPVVILNVFSLEIENGYRPNCHRQFLFDE